MLPFFGYTVPTVNHLLQLGGAMTYTDRMTQIRQQRAYSRAVASRGLSALLAPYALRAPVIPAQRRRSVAREAVSA